MHQLYLNFLNASPLGLLCLCDSFGPEYFINPVCERSSEQITVNYQWWSSYSMPFTTQTMLHRLPSVILYSCCMRRVLLAPRSRWEKLRLTKEIELKMQKGPKSQAGKRRSWYLHLSFSCHVTSLCSLTGHIMKPIQCNASHTANSVISLCACVCVAAGGGGEGEERGRNMLFQAPFQEYQNVKATRRQDEGPQEAYKLMNLVLINSMLLPKDKPTCKG